MQGTEADNGVPFIVKPDEHEVQGDELYCWLPGSDHRECNPSCVAFELRSLGSEAVLEGCKVLNSFRSISGSLSTQAKQLIIKQKQSIIKQRQDVVKDKTAPPEVR